MGEIMSLVLVALGVSLESLSVGLRYGLGKMKIRVKWIGVIGVCSGAVVMGGMMMGHFLERFFSAE
ncbi:manganese efflux pump, partial [Cytobacillus oceanisediminis]|uniref:manganese efflux pump n=1 Tax=Cytobacillus oceanisediminis TaxID=665099 RepID=UPI001642443D